jgi:hypothetical protein
VIRLRARRVDVSTEERDWGVLLDEIVIDEDTTQK